jgi:DoxX-like family
MEAITERGIFNVNSIPAAGAVRGSRKARWAGRMMSGLAILLLSFDAVAKVLQLAPVMKGSTELGYPASSVFWLGLVLLGCVALYAIPRTAALGAILLTGWFGGAIATHVRAGNPLFSHTLFPIYVAVVVWGGLYLRSGHVRSLFSMRVRE